MSSALYEKLKEQMTLYIAMAMEKLRRRRRRKKMKI